MSKNSLKFEAEKENCVEIICIGTELLLGNIVNTNAHWLANELAELGLTHYRQTVIGDNRLRLQNLIKEVAQRSKILITTGGLGPTNDDITTEAIASAFKSPLKLREEIWEDIQAKLSLSEHPVALNNRKQALFPIDAQILPNPLGTAPGMIWKPENAENGLTILTFPGVPSELKQMWFETAVPWLKKYGGSQNCFFSKVLRVTGMPESNVAEKLSDLLENQNPTIAPYASLGEIKLRLTVNALSHKEANNLLKPLETEIRHRIGENCYGENNQNLSSVVLDLLRRRGETLVAAESCTGGRLGAFLTSEPGSSDVFLGGVIVYSNHLKQKLLDIPHELLEAHGAVSKEVAEEMAKNVREKLQATWSIAISGLAGPGGGTTLKSVGLVHIAIAGPGRNKSIQKNFSKHKGRVDIQKLSVLCGLNQLRLLLLAQS